MFYQKLVDLEGWNVGESLINLAMYCLSHWRQSLRKNLCSMISTFVDILMWKEFGISKPENGAFGGVLLIGLDLHNSGSKLLRSSFESWVMIKDYQL